MARIYKGVQHLWKTLSPGFDLCYPNKEQDEYGNTSQIESAGDQIQTPIHQEERKKNSYLYDHLHSFIKFAKGDDISEETLDKAELELLNIIEPYCAHVKLPSGERILIRPIFPTDKYTMKQYIEIGAISQHSLSLRFNSVVTKVLDSSLDYLCSVNFDSHFAIGVLMEENGQWVPVASGRFIQDSNNPSEAEWAALVVDAKHGHKIGSCILYYISIMAHHLGIDKLMAVVHPENYCVRYWMNKLKGYRMFKDECDFWVFDTPIYPEWIPAEEARTELERGARVENRLSEELRSVIHDNLKHLVHYNIAEKNKHSMLNSKKV